MSMLKNKQDVAFYILLVGCAVFMVVQFLFFGSGQIADSGQYILGGMYYLDNPEAVRYLTKWNLTYIITGYLVDGLNITTLYELRLLSIPLILGHFWVAKRLLGNMVSPGILMVCVAVLVVGNFRSYHEFNNVLLASFFVMLLVGAVFLAYREQMAIYAGLAGALIPVLALLRFPSVLYGVLILLLWGVMYWDRTKHKKSWLSYVWMSIVGGLLGVAACYAILVWTDTREAYFMALQDMYGMVFDSSSLRSSGGLISSYVKTVKHAAYLTVVLSGWLVLPMWIKGVTKWKWWLLVGVGMLSVLVLMKETMMTYFFAWSVLGGLVFLDKAKSREFKFLFVLSLLALLLAPLGSSGRMVFMKPFMTVVCLIMAVQVLYNWLTKRMQVSGRICGVAMGILMLAVVVKHAAFYSQGDIEKSLLGDGSYTYASVNDELEVQVDIANRYIPKGAYVISDFYAVVTFYTGSRPWGFVVPNWVTSPTLAASYAEGAWEATKCFPYLVFEREKMDTGNRRAVIDFLSTKGRKYTVYEDDEVIIVHFKEYSAHQ